MGGRNPLHRSGCKCGSSPRPVARSVSSAHDPGCGSLLDRGSARPAIGRVDRRRPRSFSKSSTASTSAAAHSHHDQDHVFIILAKNAETMQTSASAGRSARPRRDTWPTISTSASLVLGGAARSCTRRPTVRPRHASVATLPIGALLRDRGWGSEPRCRLRCSADRRSGAPTGR